MQGSAYVPPAVAGASCPRSSSRFEQAVGRARAHIARSPRGGGRTPTGQLPGTAALRCDLPALIKVRYSFCSHVPGISCCPSWTKRKVHCVYQALIVAIATRHADAVEFPVDGRALWVALPLPAWVEYKKRTGKVITDQFAVEIAGHYLRPRSSWARAWDGKCIRSPWKNFQAPRCGRGTSSPWSNLMEDGRPCPSRTSGTLAPTFLQPPADQQFAFVNHFGRKIALVKQDEQLFVADHLGISRVAAPAIF